MFQADIVRIALLDSGQVINVIDVPTLERGTLDWTAPTETQVYQLTPIKTGNPPTNGSPRTTVISIK